MAYGAHAAICLVMGTAVFTSIFRGRAAAAIGAGTRVSHCSLPRCPVTMVALFNLLAPVVWARTSFTATWNAVCARINCAVYSLAMDPNACPQCGAWLFANRTCRCGWPKAKARKPRLRMLPVTLAVGKTCCVPGCGWPVAAKGLCWRHYRQLRKQIPPDRRKGLGCYKGLPRKLIREIASEKRARKEDWKDQLHETRAVIFGRARGRIMNLPRKQRLFVNRVSHESYERYLVRCYERNVSPMSFRAYRRRWYGAQKTNWRRFDVPRMMKAGFCTVHSMMSRALKPSTPA